MSSDDAEVRALVEQLRRLAAEQPREARMKVAQLLDERAASLDGLLQLVGLPGEGRLRQLFANAVIEKGTRAEAVPQLRYWHDVETDEFAKKALRKALDDVVKASTEQPEADGNDLVEQNLFDAYRYVQRRMMHRIGNALALPYEVIDRIKECISTSQGSTLTADLAPLIDELEDQLRLLGRIVEFDVREEHFQKRAIPIYDWLILMNERYAQKYATIELEIKADSACRDIRVHANSHLLEEIFWNLWANAHHEVRRNCRITVRMEIHNKFVRLKVVDNGQGFPEAARQAAFSYAYTSKKRDRGHSGRGLLEIRDAAEQLNGKATLIAMEGQFRMMLELPWVAG